MHCLRYLSHVYIRLYILMLPVVCEKLAVLTRVKVFITIRPLMPLKIVTQWQKVHKRGVLPLNTNINYSLLYHSISYFITRSVHTIDSSVFNKRQQLVTNLISVIKNHLMAKFHSGSSRQTCVQQQCGQWLSVV